MRQSFARPVATLRRAFAADIPAMHRVRLAVRENRLVSMALTDADYRQAIAHSGCGWVAEVKGEIVGFAVGNRITGNIWALFVHPDHEGRGYGRKLHDEMVAWLWGQGLQRLWLTTEPGTRAEGFYLRAGWRHEATTDRGEAQLELLRKR